MSTPSPEPRAARCARPSLRGPHGHRRAAGFTYVSVLLGLAITLAGGVPIFIGLSHCLKLSNLLQARTMLLSAAEGEVESVRGVPFEQLKSYTVQRPPVFGDVIVETLNPDRKRVMVRLRHRAAVSEPILLVTYVHRHGLGR